MNKRQLWYCTYEMHIRMGVGHNEACTLATQAVDKSPRSIWDWFR